LIVNRHLRTYAAITTAIQLRFDCDSTAVRLLIAHHEVSVTYHINGWPLTRCPSTGH